MCGVWPKVWCACVCVRAKECVFGSVCRVGVNVCVLVCAEMSEVKKNVEHTQPSVVIAPHDVLLVWWPQGRDHWHQNVNNLRKNIASKCTKIYI